MRFRKKTVTFFSRFRQLVCYPLGSPGQQIVGTQGGHMKTVPVSKPTAEFENNRYTSGNPEIIEGMIGYPTFGHKDGFDVNFGDLPEDWVSIYRDLPTSERRKVLRGLLNDQEDDEIMESLDPAALDNAKKDTQRVRVQEYTLTCPVSGCGLGIGGESDQSMAQAAMTAHLASAHPDWEGA